MAKLGTEPSDAWAPEEAVGAVGSTDEPAPEVDADGLAIDGAVAEGRAAGVAGLVGDGVADPPPQAARTEAPTSVAATIGKRRRFIDSS